MIMLANPQTARKPDAPSSGRPPHTISQSANTPLHNNHAITTTPTIPTLPVIPFTPPRRPLHTLTLPPKHPPKIPPIRNNPTQPPPPLLPPPLQSTYTPLQIRPQHFRAPRNLAIHHRHLPQEPIRIDPGIDIQRQLLQRQGLHFRELVF